MDHTIIKEAATKIVANIKAMEDDITVLRNKQDIISTSDTTMTGSYPGRLSIEEIGGKCEQKTYTGKNLLNLRDGVNGVRDGVAYTNRGDGSYTRVGTATGAVGNMWLKGNYSETPPDQNTNIIITLELGKSYFIGDCELFAVTSNGVAYAMIGAVTIQNEDAKINGVRNQTQAIGTAYNDVIYPRVFEGLVDLGWEPYTGGISSPNPSYPQEIKKTVFNGIKTHGKNLLENNAASQTKSGISFDVNEDKSVTINGRSTDGSSWILLKDSISLKSGQILNGVTGGGTNTANYFIQLWDNNVNKIIVNHGDGEYVVKSDYDNVGVYVGVRAGCTVEDVTIYPMIRKADIEDSTYEPYTESSIALSQPIELNGIGDVQDTIEDGKVIRRIKALHGTSGWAVTNIASGTDGYRYYVSTPDRSILNNCEVICSHYTQSTVASYWVTGDYICTSEPNCICIRSTSISTLDEFNVALANMTIYYPLATPVIEELPLVDQMTLNNLKTYDGITYVEIDSEIEPTFQGKYGITKNGGYILEGMLAGRNGEQLAKSNGDRITTLESTVVNNI